MEEIQKKIEKLSKENNCDLEVKEEKKEYGRLNNLTHNVNYIFLQLFTGTVELNSTETATGNSKEIDIKIDYNKNRISDNDVLEIKENYILDYSGEIDDSDKNYENNKGEISHFIIFIQEDEKLTGIEKPDSSSLSFDYDGQAVTISCRENIDGTYDLVTNSR